MKYSVEVMRVREQTIQLNGWAVESNPDSVITYRVEDEAGQPVKAKIVPTRRDDVSQIYYKKIIDRDLGFDIRFPYEHGKNYYLVICGGKKTTRVKQLSSRLSKTLTKVCKMLRVKENITWYSARGSFISKMVDAGNNPYVVAEMAGNSPLTIYKHYYKNTKRDEIKKQMEQIF